MWRVALLCRLLPIIVEHTIDEQSPLCGHTHDSLLAVRLWPDVASSLLHCSVRLLQPDLAQLYKAVSRRASVRVSLTKPAFAAWPCRQMQRSL